MTELATAQRRDAADAPGPVDLGRAASRAATDGRIRFPTGLLGFPHVNEYRLVEGPAPGLYWLEGVPDSPTFLLSDPFVFFEGLGLDVSRAHAAQIDAREAAEVAVLAVTVPDVSTGVFTANLQGPIVINVQKALGAQVVLSDPSLGVRREFRPTLPGPRGATSVDRAAPSKAGIDEQLIDLL